MVLEFEAEAIEWRGPAPFIFVPVPPELSSNIKAVSSLATYGWGCIPANVQIGKTEYTTSLFPKGGIYLVPVKLKVQKAEDVRIGRTVKVSVSIDLSRR